MTFSFQKSVRAFPELTILVFGDVILDHYLLSNVSRISPEAPVPIAHVLEENYKLGGAANVAHNLRALGVKTHLMGWIGDDAPGKILVDLLNSMEIDTEDLLVRKDLPTIQKTRVISHQQQLLRIDREKFKPLESALIDDFQIRLKALIPQCDAVVLSDYAKGALTHSLVQIVIEEARKNTVPVIADPKPVNKAFYQGVPVLLPNHYEAAQLAHRVETDEAALIDIGKIIQKELGCDLIVTCGPQGMKVFSGSNYVSVPTKARQVYDVTGAGDTVTAVVAAGLANGLSLVEAATLASFAAGLVVEKFGTATVGLNELLELLDSSAHD